MTEQKLRVQDDLFHSVNAEWLENAVIPDDKPAISTAQELDLQVEALMIADMNKMSAGQIPCTEESLQKAVTLYTLAKNIKRRDREGIRPVLPTLRAIEKVRDVQALNRKLKEFVLRGYPLPFTLSVDADMKHTDRHALLIGGPSTILPDTGYYKEGMETQKEALLGVWSDMSEKLLTFTDLDADTRSRYIQDALAFDAIIATLVKSSEEWSDYVAIYNPMKTGRVAGLLKPLAFKKLLKALFGEALPETVIVAEPRFLKGFSTLFNEENFTLYKHWAYIKALQEAAPLLSRELREIAFTYRKALSGVASTSTIEKQAYQLASANFSEPMGLYYGRTYFGEEAKQDIVELVHEIIDTYKRRVSENDILSPATKEKAILKLSKMGVKMGYPDKEDALYSLLTFDPKASLYKAVGQLDLIRTTYHFSKLWQPVDREQWVMPGHMVNACYNPFTNDVTFPAAFLQEPFYSVHQTRSENLGGIGTVVGHEVSHAFDNNGAQCDENGNLNNWWTKEDYRKFKARTKAMVRQFEGIELPWGKVNSAFIVSENIADNGGMAVALDIMGHMEEKDYEAFFLHWGKIWRIKARPEFARLLLQVDVHAPGILRANMPPRNFPEWYETFRVKRSDQMYIAPGKRVIIW